ncbi:oligosaccharide flippase family protein [Vibrio parahaemolyticus]|nr:oligosaccharide flippase family protein [Vibrio parahaemolyticus]
MKNILMLFSSTLFSSILTLFTQTLIASRLTPEEFGIFSSSLALVMLLFPLIAIGSDGYWLKFSADRSLRQSDFNSNWVVFFYHYTHPSNWFVLYCR